MTKIRFHEIREKVPPTPGLYEIRTDDGVALKVGIGANLRKRLLQHRASLQRGLQIKGAVQAAGPTDVISKRSILAKHLYFDTSIAQEYDLRTEAGRARFLDEKCYITFVVAETKEQARELEREREKQGGFRYTGKVIER